VEAVAGVEHPQARGRFGIGSRGKVSTR